MTECASEVEECEQGAGDKKHDTLFLESAISAATLSMSYPYIYLRAWLIASV